jgi:hypothetical protein
MVRKSIKIILLAVIFIVLIFIVSRITSSPKKILASNIIIFGLIEKKCWYFRTFYHYVTYKNLLALI